MKINDVAVYKDGGTKLIETDEGTYWITCDIPKKVFKGENYFKGEAVEIFSHEEIINLMDALCYNASDYHWIKRRCK